MSKEKRACFGILAYWEKIFPDDLSYSLKLYDKYLFLKERNQNPLPFLLEMNAKYPDAPDILRWLALEYQENNEFLKALQIFTKLIELNPDLEHYKKDFEACRAFVEFRSMSETDESLKWLGKRIQEIWK